MRPQALQNRVPRRREVKQVANWKRQQLPAGLQSPRQTLVHLWGGEGHWQAAAEMPRSTRYRERYLLAQRQEKCVDSYRGPCYNVVEKLGGATIRLTALESMEKIDFSQ